jgi:hypothetical protein
LTVDTGVSFHYLILRCDFSRSSGRNHPTAANPRFRAGKDTGPRQGVNRAFAYILPCRIMAISSQNPINPARR